MPDEQYGVRFTAKDETKKAIKSARSGINKLVAAYAALGIGAVAVFKGFKSGIKYVKEITAAAGKQELGERKIAAALQSTGQYSDETFDLLRRQASELQRLTTVGDEATLAQMALAVGMGAPVDKLGQMSAALADTTAAGLPAETMVRGLAASFLGNASALTRYIPAVKELTKEELKAGGALELIEAQFGQFAEAEAQTFTGSIQRIKNAWGDVRESQGMMITQSPVLLAAMNQLTTAFLDHSEAISGNTEDYVSFVDRGVLNLVRAGKPTLQFIGTARVAWLNLTHVFDLMIASLETQASLLVDLATGPGRLVLEVLEATGTISAGTTQDVLGFADGLRTMARESRQVVEDAGEMAQRIKAETRASVAELEGHEAAILRSAQAMRDQGTPESENLAGAYGAIGAAAKDAAEAIKETTEAALVDQVVQARLLMEGLQAAEAEYAVFTGEGEGVAEALGLIREQMSEQQVALSDAKRALSDYRLDLEGIDEVLEEIERGEWAEEQAAAILKLAEDSENAGGRIADVLLQIRQGHAKSVAESMAEYRTLGDAMLEHADDWLNLGGTIGDVVTNTMFESVGAAFGAIGNLIDDQIDRLDGLSEGWKAAISTVVNMLLEIVTAVISAALAQGIASAVSIAAESSQGTGKAAAGIFFGVLAGVIAAVVAAIASAEAEKGAIGAQEGGLIVGPGPKGRDSVPILAAPGEVVLPVDVVDSVRSLLRSAIAPVGTVALPMPAYAQAGGVVAGPAGGWEAAFGAGEQAASSVTQHVSFASFVPESRTEFRRKFDIATRRLYRTMRARRAI